MSNTTARTPDIGQSWQAVAVRTRSLGVLVATACLAVTGCSADDNDAAAPPTSTTAPSTTMPPTTTARQAVEHSVVVGEHGVLGAWTDGRWVDAGVNEPNPFEGGQEYTLVPFDGPLATA